MDVSNKTILIIEDEDSLQSAFKSGFEAHGFTVLTANNGRDGLDIIKGAGPDVVVLDLLMPEMNGEEVLQEMFNENLTERIPVIVVSNKSDGASLYNCKKLGARDYLIKVNVTVTDIMNKINEILEEK